MLYKYLVEPANGRTESLHQVSNNKQLQGWLEFLGVEGWEFVSYCPFGYIFRKPIEQG